MPLYEFLIVAKPGTAKRSVELLQDIVGHMLREFPSIRIREVQNLGDRIMGNSINRNKMTNNIGRYLQIMMDAPPAVNKSVRGMIRQNYRHDVFLSSMHRVNDLDYAVNMYFRAGKSIDPFTDVKDYPYAQKVMDMKDKVDKYD